LEFIVILSNGSLGMDRGKLPKALNGKRAEEEEEDFSM
jgi:hypothetical protein